MLDSVAVRKIWGVMRRCVLVLRLPEMSQCSVPDAPQPRRQRNHIVRFFFIHHIHISWALVVPKNLVLGPFPPTTVDTHSHRLIAMPIPEAV